MLILHKNYYPVTAISIVSNNNNIRLLEIDKPQLNSIGLQAGRLIASNQIKSNLFVTQNTDTNERRKTKSNVPTGHKGSKDLH